MPRFTINLKFSGFRRDVAESLKRHPSIKDDLAEVLKAVEENHVLGVQIPGVGCQVRKVRVGCKKAGIGQRKGYRLLYWVDEDTNVITALCFHFKPQIQLIPNKDIEKLISRAASERRLEATEGERSIQ